MTGYEVEVKSYLEVKDGEYVYDREVWNINGGRVEWRGNGEELGRYVEELVEDVFGVSGRIEWQGEDDEDYGYYEVGGGKIICKFGEKK